jgi:hypothetical protein
MSALPLELSSPETSPRRGAPLGKTSTSTEVFEDLAR